MFRNLCGENQHICVAGSVSGSTLTAESQKCEYEQGKETEEETHQDDQGEKEREEERLTASPALIVPYRRRAGVDSRRVLWYHAFQVATSRSARHLIHCITSALFFYIDPGGSSMRKTVASVSALAFVCLFLFLSVQPAPGADTGHVKGVQKGWNQGDFIDGWTYSGGAASGCYSIVSYDFELLNWQGWHHHNNNAQADSFWHVDHSPEAGGDLAWVLGAYSDPADPYLCSWSYDGGYGNNWDQSIEFSTETFIYFEAELTIAFHVIVDTEPEYDYLAVEHDDGSGWDELGRFSGSVDSIASFSVTGGNVNRFRFHFVSDGAYSPQDDGGLGIWPYGNLSVDDIEITADSEIIDFEDCDPDSVSVGDRRTDSDGNGDYWIAGVDDPQDYSGLAGNLYDKDPCNDNYGTQVVFFIGSPHTSDDYPLLFDTPFVDQFGKSQDEMAISPVVDLARYSSGNDNNQDGEIPPGDLQSHSGINLRFRVYRDLPLENQVFYFWRIRSVSDGCPGAWRDRGFYYFNGSSQDQNMSGEYGEKDYFYADLPVGDLVETDSIQVAVGVVDMCDIWYERFLSDCVDHTPAPWFDDVSIVRCGPAGPQWGYRPIDLFQDDFPEYTESDPPYDGFVRADMAADINPPWNPEILPGDSIVISCAAPLSGGLDTLSTGEDRVYMHVRCTWIGNPDSTLDHPGLYGSELEGDRGHYVSDDGLWTTFIADYAVSGSGFAPADMYCFDLNDSIFTRGYMIEYYFEAFDLDGNRSTLPSDIDDTGESPYRGGSKHFEFTCLPSFYTDILYVDDFDGRGSIKGAVQDYFDPAFNDVLPPDNQPDRFDVNGPSSMAGNGLGSRAAYQQLEPAYRNMIWDSGDLRYATVSDGTGGDKSPDLQLMLDWVTNANADHGFWFLGDNLPQDVKSKGALTGVMIHDSYLGLTGEFNPIVSWDLAMSGLSFYLYGGCPIANDFDAFDSIGHAGGGSFSGPFDHPSGSLFTTYIESAAGPYDIYLVWSGFSFMAIRDASQSTSARNRALRDVMMFFETDTNPDITGDDVPPAYADYLLQNYPNPFNPVTTITYGVKIPAKVSLRIYNVAGQLVRTLVDERQDAGNYRITWDGKNDEGHATAAGVYFYRLRNDRFTSTKKMVLIR
jgi:hypothetical protein